MQQTNVLVVGGGVAALETTLALRELAGDRAAVTLIAPDPEFVYRPMTVREPFAGPAARRHDLREMADDMGAKLVADKLVRVDAANQIVHLQDGEPMHYDELVLAVGGRRYERFSHVTTIDDHHLDDQLHGLVQDIELEYVGSVAFLIPARMAWPLPIYELALMTAARAYAMGVEVKLTIVTPEASPLAVFGLGASHAMAELLAKAGVAVELSADANVTAKRTIVMEPGSRRLEADHIVALPELFGPAVEGLPVARDGFLPVDEFCRVPGVDHVYAAGDGADFPIKHGGLAAQQADTVALAIAADAGAPVEPSPYRPEIHGMLLTGGAPRFITARLVDGQGVDSAITETPTWSPPTKIAARYLAPYLEEAEARRAVAS
jgi:sulfide:quinone oxidoreductase